jgi:hypothetical protein
MGMRFRTPENTGARELVRLYSPRYRRAAVPGEFAFRDIAEAGLRLAVSCLFRSLAHKPFTAESRGQKVREVLEAN